MKSFRLTIIAVTTAIVLAVGAWTYAYVVNANRVADVDAVVSTIQNERVANIRSACEKQNRDNRRVFVELRKLTRATNKAEGRTSTAEQKQQQRQTLQDFADAVHERRDCDEVVRRSTGKSQAKQ